MELLSAAVPRRAYVRRLLVDLFAFTACAFALTWIVVGLYIWNADAATRALGPLRLGAPAFYLAVYAPSLAAIAVTCARYGRAGLANLFRRSEEHTSELQSLMRISYAVFCLKKKNNTQSV